MADDVAASIKRENDISLTLDREHDALWQELTKYQMTCTDDYTGKVLDEQIREQCNDVEARRSTLSVSQGYIESLLESSASICDTANGGVQVLSDTLSYAEGELEDYFKRVEEIRREREQALEAATRSVTLHRVKLEELYQQCLRNKDHPSGLEKLSALLSKLKVAEDTNFTAAEEGSGGIAQHIKQKTSSGNTTRQSINELESKCAEIEHFVSNMSNNLRFQSEKIAEAEATVKHLDIEKIETFEEVAKQRRSLKLLLSKSTADTLSIRANEVKDHCRRLSDIRSRSTALKTSSLSKYQDWQNELNQRKDEISSKLAMLEQQKMTEQEKLYTLNCRLEGLKEQFIGDPEKKDWDEQKWRKVLEEHSEGETRLDSKITKITEEIFVARGTLTHSDEGENVADAIVALERDLLSYVGRYNEERKMIQERRMEILSRLSIAQSKIAGLKANNAEKESEHQRLLLEVKNLQAQIDAFTNLRTPAKDSNTPAAKSLKTTTGRRASRRMEELDSDDGSAPSGVPYVEGLQPFSPATVSFKEQAKRKSRKLKKSGNVEDAISIIQPAGNPSAVEAPIIPPKPAGKVAVATEVQESAQIDENGSVIESLFDLSGSEKSPSCESLVAKRFPSDIFLKKSPSLGQNESGSSPDVSAIGSTDMDTDREDADQSVWSVVPAKPANCTHLDTTAETDLDQSVW